MGKYDALPGISQKAQPTKEALEAGSPGHGCGHNLFGVASLGAAIAAKELIAAGKLEGTVRFFGTPAEESVSGKVCMLKGLATTMVDLFRDPKTVDAMKSEFATKTKGVTYKPYVPDGPPPVPAGDTALAGRDAS